MRSDAAVSTSMLISWGRGLQEHVEALPVADQDRLYRDVAQAVADHVGTDLSALVSHRDEVSPHAHALMPAVHPDGRPLSKCITRQVASEIQDIAMAAAQPYLPMIERGVSKRSRLARGDDPSAIYNRSVRQLHEDLPRELEAAQSRVLEMQVRVSDLEERETRTAREEKRLDIYRSRLKKRHDDLDGLARRLISDREALGIQREIQDRVEDELDAREGAVDQREDLLRRVYRVVHRMTGDVADHLGVGRSLREIKGAIEDSGIEISDPDTPSI